MKRELVMYRLLDSHETLGSAEILYANQKYKDSISRSYYAMFAAARALLATIDNDSVNHSGIVSLFNLHFVKTGKVSREMGKLLIEARSLREKGDYADFLVISKDEA